MSVIERVHASWVFKRRVEVLSRTASSAIAPHAPESLLDVGCGDGQITARIAAAMPKLRVAGIDVFARPQTHFPVQIFDGSNIPYADASFDVVMAVDVLHHAEDPLRLLSEMSRVARRLVVLKDHYADGWGGRSILKLMDQVGNERHGVSLPYCYLSRAEWTRSFEKLGLQRVYESAVPHLYAWPLSLVFGRRLHFLSVLEKSSEAGRPSFSAEKCAVPN
jgi:SAM-dependent methyltransferase